MADWPAYGPFTEGGVIVDIHRPDNLPSLEETGLHIRPGSITYIALTEVLYLYCIYRLKKPVGVCKIW